MSAPYDRFISGPSSPTSVLVTLRAAAKTLDILGGYTSVAAVNEAHDEVAELIEAASDLDMTPVNGLGWTEARDRLNAAIRRCKAEE